MWIYTSTPSCATMAELGAFHRLLTRRLPDFLSGCRLKVTIYSHIFHHYYHYHYYYYYYYY
jgi:hypothetical protein